MLLVSGAGYLAAEDQPYDAFGFTNSSAVELWDLALAQIDFVGVHVSPPRLPMLGQRLFDTYERRD